MTTIRRLIMKNQKVWADANASNLVLKNGEQFRVPVMFRDNKTVACVTCNDTGRHPAGIWCPDCNHGNQRGGSMHTDHAINNADMRVRDYMLDQQKYGQHRPGFKNRPVPSKARHADRRHLMQWPRWRNNGPMPTKMSVRSKRTRRD